MLSKQKNLSLNVLLCLAVVTTSKFAVASAEVGFKHLHAYALSAKLSYQVRDGRAYRDVVNDIKSVYPKSYVVNLSQLQDPEHENIFGYPNPDVKFEALVLPDNLGFHELVIAIKGKETPGDAMGFIKLTCVTHDEVAKAFQFHQSRFRELGIEAVKKPKNFVKELQGTYPLATRESFRRDIIENQLLPLLRDLEKLFAHKSLNSGDVRVGKIKSLRFVGHGVGGELAKLLALIYNNKAVQIKRIASVLPGSAQSVTFGSPGLKAKEAILLIVDVNKYLLDSESQKSVEDYTNNEFITKLELARHQTVGHVEDFFFNLGNIIVDKDDGELALVPEGPYLTLNMGPVRVGYYRGDKATQQEKILNRAAKDLFGFAPEDFVPNRIDEIINSLEIIEETYEINPGSVDLDIRVKNSAPHYKFRFLNPEE